MVLHPLEGVEAVSLQEGGVREAGLVDWPAARVEGGVREAGCQCSVVLVTCGLKMNVLAPWP